MKPIALLMLVCVGVSVALECGNSEIACSTNEECIPYEHICDSGKDCADGLDEDKELCAAWKNTKCDRSFVECTRNGVTNCTEISEYCTLESPPCEGELDRRICLMLKIGRINKPSEISHLLDITESNLNKSKELGEKFRSLLLNTLSHESCPKMYTLVGDQCLSFFYLGKMRWIESQYYCREFKGELLTLNNVSHFADIVKHLQKYELPSDFWIGGSNENATLGWAWLDGSPMEMGSPFWATRYSADCVQRNVTVAKSETKCYHFYQAPEVVPQSKCASLSFEHAYYITDEDCQVHKSPICVYKGSDFPNGSTF
ncbi:uncharacterized protein [Palaemon carinicauda]|uniref:uncharacterized protein n=1 Tax=Palaemon carinicauda TaxID=392227 RepID=UPI0035B605BA